MIEIFRSVLESVGKESAPTNGVWRLMLAGFWTVCTLLGGVMVWLAVDALDTLHDHTVALNKMERSLAVVKLQLIEQNERVNKTDADTAAIEVRTRNLEDHFSAIGGKLDVLLSVVRTPTP